MKTNINSVPARFQNTVTSPLPAEDLCNPAPPVEFPGANLRDPS